MGVVGMGPDHTRPAGFFPARRRSARRMHAQVRLRWDRPSCGDSIMGVVGMGPDHTRPAGFFPVAGTSIATQGPRALESITEEPQLKQPVKRDCRKLSILITYGNQMPECANITGQWWSTRLSPWRACAKDVFDGADIDIRGQGAGSSAPTSI
jgi:hypothetical protein